MKTEWQDLNVECQDLFRKGYSASLLEKIDDETYKTIIDETVVENVSYRVILVRDERFTKNPLVALQKLCAMYWDDVFWKEIF